jgi:2-aminoadipate transaminase
VTKSFDFRNLLKGDDGRSDLALPLRIRNAMMGQIASGSIPAGTRLPTIRTLAQILNVNPMTAAKGYKLLVEAGYATARGSNGTVARLPDMPVQPLHADTGSKPRIGPAALSQRLFSLARAPGVIGFTTNYPDPAIADVRSFRECLVEAASDESNLWFRYDPAAGRDELRAELVPFLAQRSINAHMRDIIVTAGGQQALDLVVRSVVMPGDVVMVERPTYFGGLNVLRAARARIIDIPLEDDGPDIDILETVMRQHRPRLLYLNPTFHNPTGITTSLAKRQQILALAHQHGASILEDDHSPELRFSGKPVPSIKALAEPEDAVYYAAGFGKSFIPGIRLGMLLPPKRSSESVLALKATTDLQSTAVMQGALALYLQRGSYKKHMRSTIETYRGRQKSLLHALRANLPDDVKCSSPEGGLSLWLRFPTAGDVSNLYDLAAQHSVAFASGDSFFASNPDMRSLRMSFGLTADSELVEGAKRISAVIRELVDPDSRSPATVL